jgi:hypothetical protein
MKTIGTLLAVVALVHIAPVSAAPVQWSGNGHWYEAIHMPAGITWQNARDAALSLGGYLATTTSAEENAFVYSLVLDEQLWVNIGNGQGPWLGGYQPAGSPEPSGGWAWVTGEPWSYTNWAFNQPDNGDNAETGLEFFKWGPSGTGPFWNDYKNDANLFSQPRPVAYVVEYLPEPSSLALSVAGAIAVIGFASRHNRRGQ